MRPAPRRVRAGLGRLAATTARVAGRPTAAVALLGLRATARRRGLVLVFHRISSKRGGMTQPTDPDVFAAQIRTLRRFCVVVPASAILREVTERRRWQRFPVALSFDDDLRSHRQVAAPLLTRNGLSATFFLNGASLHAPHEFWWELLDRALRHDVDLAGLVEIPRDAPLSTLGETIERWPPERRAVLSRRLAERLGGVLPSAGLRAEDVSALERSGHAIGFHTQRHHRLTELPERDLDEAVTAGRAELQAVVEQPIEALAYPHGVADQRVADCAARAGYSFGFTAGDGAVEPDAEPLLLPRVEASPESAGRLALQIVRTLSARRRHSAPSPEPAAASRDGESRAPSPAPPAAP